MRDFSLQTGPTQIEMGIPGRGRLSIKVSPTCTFILVLLIGSTPDFSKSESFRFDFYLQAHAGLQGTVRPTHYTVVYDENRLGADEVQQGTHHASYLYARATKAVSLVPAAYYSDLCCERGRCFINDFLSAPDDKTSSAGTGTGVGKGKGRGKVDREEEEDRVFSAAKDAWGEGLHGDVKDSMFYI